MKTKLQTILTIIAISTASYSYAQERLDMEGTAIIGNKELPRVLYIVPWKSVERFEITTPRVVSIMEQELTPLDRPTFIRRINYHDAIFANAKPAITPNQ